MSEGATQPRRRSLATNSFFSVLAWLFPIALGFIATPVLVRNLGTHEYGIFAIALGFISYSFTFGAGKVAAKYVPEYLAAGEPERAGESVSATFWLSLSIGVVGSLALVLIAPLLVRDVLLVPRELQEAAVYALYLAGAIGLVFMLSQVFQYVLQGLHRFDNYVTITNFNGLLLGAGNIILAINGFGVVALLAWNLGVMAFTGILFYLRAKHLLPSIRLAPIFTREMALTVAKYGGNIALYQLFGNALLIFERAWVMRRFGAEELTFYFVPMLLAIHMHGFLSSIVQALFPVVNELLDDVDRVIYLYRRANKITLAIVFFAVTNFVTCGALFLRYWVSPELSEQSYVLLVIHGLTFSVIAVGIMAFQLAEVFKFPALNVIITAAWMVVSVPLMIAFSGIWEAEGVALARFAASLVTLPIVAYAERRFLGKVQWKFWLASVGVVFTAAAVMAATQMLLFRILPVSAFSLAVAGVAGGAVFGLVLMLTGYLTPQDRARILGILRRRRGNATAE